MMTRIKTLVDSATGLKFAESPRWHDGKLWFLDIPDKRIKTLKAAGYPLDHDSSAGRESPGLVGGADRP